MAVISGILVVLFLVGMMFICIKYIDDEKFN